MSDELPPVPTTGELSLPNGHTLYWRVDPTINCREYFSDEIGGGVMVWFPALVDENTMLAAIVQEARLRRLEQEHAKRAQQRVTGQTAAAVQNCTDEDRPLSAGVERDRERG
jgi:hypothetical protein